MGKALEGGYHGSLEISDIVEIVHEAAYRPNIRWISSRWGPRQGAPANTVTLLFGAWHTDYYGKDPHRDHAASYNIPTPFVPELDVLDGDKVKARGWRPLLIEMIVRYNLRMTKRIKRLLGEEYATDLEKKVERDAFKVA